MSEYLYLCLYVPNDDNDDHTYVRVYVLTCVFERGVLAYLSVIMCLYKVYIYNTICSNRDY